MIDEEIKVSKLRQSVHKVYSDYINKQKGFDIDEAIQHTALTLNLPIPYVTVTINTAPSRNDFIIERFLSNDSIQVLAKDFNLAETRIRQIISPFIKRRDTKKEIEFMGDLVNQIKAQFEQDLPNAIINKTKVESPYELLIQKVGRDVFETMPNKESLVKKFKQNVYIKLGKTKVDGLKTFGFNAYKELTAWRNHCICRLAGNDEVKMQEIFESAGIEYPNATDIALAMGMTRDRIYGILHSEGIRKREKLTQEERKQRNASILAARKAGQSVQTIAETMGLSRVMISNILNEKASNKKTRIKNERLT